MEIINCEQGSESWFQARLGIPTASHFKEIVTTTGALSKSADKYMLKLAGEKVSGFAEQSYQNAAMLHGIETEDEARQLYQIITGDEVKEVGFCVKDGAGASPDGLVGDDGLVEIKCPQVATHVGYLIENKLPTAYFQQVQGQLYITGRKWCDFMSYYQGLKPFMIRVERDVNFIESLKRELKNFTEKLEETINKIK